MSPGNRPAIDDLGRNLSMPPGTTLREYVEDLKASGVRASPGTGGTYWVASRGIVRRLPTFHVGAPRSTEVDRALRATGALVASYLTDPDEGHAANAYLYLCADHDYSLRTLAPVMRRNLRRAMRELTIAPLGKAELLTHGAVAFCDSRKRAGLDDGTVAGFRRYFHHGFDRPRRAYLGAWKNGHLAAFVTIVRVDDWAELGSFSMSSMLRYRPNDALMYAAMSKYLSERSCRVVSYGVSSVQEHSNAAGLHRFKLKLGFNPSRVHRAFVFHPSVRPFVRRAALTAAHWTANGALRVRPRDHRLKKLGGMLACMLGSTSMLHAVEGSDDQGRDGAPWQGDSLCAT